MKHEVNRLLNKITELCSSAEIVVKKLDFRSTRLLKRMKRLLSRFGKGHLIANMKALQERLALR